jgi:hypothetical protein
MAYKISAPKEPISLANAQPFTEEQKKEYKKLFEIKSKKEEKKKLFLEEIKKKGTITEQEINLIKRRLNDGTYKEEDITEFYDLNITPEQTEKGLTWLKNKGWGKTGKERSTTPYGYIEEDTIKTFEKFEFKGFTNISTYGDFKNYVPIYRVEGKDTSFEYYVQGGEPQIIG